MSPVPTSVIVPHRPVGLVGQTHPTFTTPCEGENTL
jgi:hypothetical protein